jgi:pyridoxamine 5'-phosphate oxidase
MPGTSAALREQDVDPDPLRQFTAWFQEVAAQSPYPPEAAAVATASRDGAPSVRMVLVKQFDEHGFVFFTNYESRKAQELAENPRAALLFYWDRLGRQVRIEGAAERARPEESVAYARRRARASQLSALASPQSQVIEDREALERRVSELAARYEGIELPVHETWGGYRIIPQSYEFWQQRDDRLHDRLRYVRDSDRESGWRIERLAP